MILGKKNAAVSGVLLLHAALVAVSFCGSQLWKISVCAGIRLLSASMNDLPRMKNTTRG